MVIHIPDDIDPKERRRRLNSMATAYALCKFGFSRKKSAAWLGLSYRCFKDRMRNDSTLWFYIKELSAEERKKSSYSKEDYKRIWHNKRKQMIDEFKKTLKYRQMSESERQKVIDNINRIYA